MCGILGKTAERLMLNAECSMRLAGPPLKHNTNSVKRLAFHIQHSSKNKKLS